MIFLSGVGIFLFIKGAFQGGFSIWPASIAFLAALLFALEGLLISILGRAEPAFTVMLYVTTFGLCVMAWPAFAEWRTLGWHAAVICVLLGPLDLIAQYCTIRGYRAAPLSIVAPVDYAWLLFSAILGIAVFTEIPNIGTWVGCGVIITAGVILPQSGNRR